VKDLGTEKGGNVTVMLDDSGEEVPSDSIAAVVCVMM
jgi:hypothetical protein